MWYHSEFVPLTKLVIPRTPWKKYWFSHFEPEKKIGACADVPVLARDGPGDEESRPSLMERFQQNMADIKNLYFGGVEG